MAQHEQLPGIGRVVIRGDGDRLRGGLRYGMLHLAALHLAKRMLSAKRSLGGRGLDETPFVLARPVRSAAAAECRGHGKQGRQHGVSDWVSFHGYFELEESMGAQFVRPDMTQS
jgi:hypothetical protein